MSLPAYIEVQAGAFERVSHLESLAGVNLGNPIVVLGKRPTVLPGFLDRFDSISIPDNDIGHAQDLAAQIDRYSAVIGVGSGKVIDPAKWAASATNLPFVCVPTSLSNDGIASPVSILAREGRTHSYAAQTPQAILVDTDLIAESPKALIRSGIGDLMANWNARDDAQLTGPRSDTREVSFAYHLAISAALLVTSQRSALTSREFMTSLAHGLILSGTAMEIAGSSAPASGSEHEISHAIDELFPGKASHGDQVSVATMYMGLVRRADWLDNVTQTLLFYGVPMLPDHIGLTSAQFCDAVDYAPQTRPERKTLLEHLSMSRTEIERTVDAFVNTWH